MMLPVSGLKLSLSLALHSPASRDGFDLVTALVKIHCASVSVVCVDDWVHTRQEVVVRHLLEKEGSLDVVFRWGRKRWGRMAPAVISWA